MNSSLLHATAQCYPLFSFLEFSSSLSMISCNFVFYETNSESRAITITTFAKDRVQELVSDTNSPLDEYVTREETQYFTQVYIHVCETKTCAYALWLWEKAKTGFSCMHGFLPYLLTMYIHCSRILGNRGKLLLASVSYIHSLKEHNIIYTELWHVLYSGIAIIILYTCKGCQKYGTELIFRNMFLTVLMLKYLCNLFMQ